MTRTTRTLAGIGAAVLIAGLLPPAAGAATTATSGGAAAAPRWAAVPADWPTDDRVEVTDVAAHGKVGWVVGNVGTADEQRPVVQRCAAGACTAAELPVLDGTATTRVNGVSAASATQVWAVGTARFDGEPWYTGVVWHLVDGAWSVQRADLLGDLQLGDVVSVGADELWATGWVDYEDGATATLYHVTAGSWTEINPQSTPELPAPCDSWWWNEWDDLVLDGASPVLTGRCDGEPVVVGLVDGQWQRLDGGLPADVRWREATVVQGRLWLAGSAADGTISVVRRTASGWQPVTTKGLPSTPTLADLGGSRPGHVWLVGRHDGVAASWVWTSERWRAVEVTTDGDSGLAAVSARGTKRAYAAGFDLGREPGQSGIVLRER